MVKLHPEQLNLQLHEGQHQLPILLPIPQLLSELAPGIAHQQAEATDYVRK